MYSLKNPGDKIEVIFKTKNPKEKEKIKELMDKKYGKNYLIKSNNLIDNE